MDLGRGGCGEGRRGLEAEVDLAITPESIISQQKIIIDSMSYTKAKLIMTYYTPWDANYSEINNRISCLLQQQGPYSRPAIAAKPKPAIKFSIWTGKIFVINIPSAPKRKQLKI